MDVDEGTSDAMNDKRRRRYNLILPDEVFSQVERIANEWGTSYKEVIQRLLKVGFIVVEAERSEDKAVYIQEGESLKQIRFM